MSHEDNCLDRGCSICNGHPRDSDFESPTLLKKVPTTMSDRTTVEIEMSHKIDPLESNAIIPRKDYERLLKCEAACSGLKDPEKDIREIVEAARGALNYARHCPTKFSERVDMAVASVLESALAKFENIGEKNMINQDIPKVIIDKAKEVADLIKEINHAEQQYSLWLKKHERLKLTRIIVEESYCDLFNRWDQNTNKIIELQEMEIKKT